MALGTKKDREGPFHSPKVDKLTCDRSEANSCANVAILHSRHVWSNPSTFLLDICICRFHPFQIPNFFGNPGRTKRSSTHDEGNYKSSGTRYPALTAVGVNLVFISDSVRANELRRNELDQYAFSTSKRLIDKSHGLGETTLYEVRLAVRPQ